VRSINAPITSHVCVHIPRGLAALLRRVAAAFNAVIDDGDVL